MGKVMISRSDGLSLTEGSGTIRKEGNKMKKMIFVLALAMLMLTGCSGKKTEQMPAAEPPKAAVEPTEELGALITLPAPQPTAAPATIPPTPPVTETVAPPTTAPAAPAAIVITKHPTSETVSVGAGTWFIANAENETQITWEFFSPDGTMYSLQQTMSAHPGLILEVLPKDTLGLRQIPASFSGWSARARYDGPGGTATTQRATITVRDPYSVVIETYREVHRSGKGNIEKEISELVNAYDFLGYTLMDVDGNGVDELILASDSYNEYPNVIYGVYTIENGKAECLIKSAARSRYFMMQDGRFLMEGSSGAMYSSWITYDFSNDLVAVQDQIWTSEEPHDMADFAPYYYYSVPYGPSEPMVYDEAARIIESWERSVRSLSLTPIN